MPYRDPFYDPMDFNALDNLYSAPILFDKRRRLGTTEGTFSIRSEVLDTDTEYLVALEVPGVTKDTVNLTVDSNVLTVKFIREKDLHAHESGSVVSSDFNYGAHVRRFQLPQNVNQDAAIATFVDGVLRVKFPKLVRKEGAKKLLIK